MEYIWKDVDCNTALRAYEFAKLFDDTNISEKSMKVRIQQFSLTCSVNRPPNSYPLAFQIISEQTTDILSKAGALNMNLATLLDILDQDQLNTSAEVYLFNVLQSWVLFNVQNKNGNYPPWFHS